MATARRVRAGARPHLVRLEEVAADDTPVTFDPDEVWVAIRPSSPTAFGENKITHQVELDYHPQITLNTRLFQDDDRALYVRGIQDVNDANAAMVLLCEEVLGR